MKSPLPAPDIEEMLCIDVIAKDREWAKERKLLVRQRFFAGLFRVLVDLPAIDQLHIHLAVSQLTASIRTMPDLEVYTRLTKYPSPEDAGKYGEKALVAKAFYKRFSKTRKCLGTSNKTVDTLRNMLPLATRGMMSLPRQEWMNICQIMLKDPEKVLDETLLLELRTPSASMARSIPRL